MLNFLFHYVGAKLSGAKLPIFLSLCQIVQCQIVRRQIVLPPCIALSSKHSGLPKTRNGPCGRGRKVFQTIRASPHTFLPRNGQCPYMEKNKYKRGFPYSVVLTPSLMVFWYFSEQIRIFWLWTMCSAPMTFAGTNKFRSGLLFSLFQLVNIWLDLETLTHECHLVFTFPFSGILSLFQFVHIVAK